MQQFYALATDKENNIIPIANFPENLSRIEIQNSAISYCKRNNLTFKELRQIPGTQRQNSTLTKTIESKRGRQLNW